MAQRAGRNSLRPCEPWPYVEHGCAPLVLVVEDLHWIDTSSEEFLTAMLDAVPGVPLLFLVTYRIGYTPPFGSRSFYTTLTLRSFSEAETLAMAGHILGIAQFPAELRTALIAKAEGVPLFIEEVTKALLDLGVLRRENNSYRLVKGLSEVSVPETIQEIIMARLDRLGEDGKRTVQLASVIGRQFLVQLLARVAGLADRFEGLLRELQALEIIYEQGLLPEPAYIFKHAVIQDVAYNSLLVRRRKALHQIVGDAIEEIYQDRLEEHYPELTHHFSQGEVWDKAFFYWRQAGARAFARSALREAMACFEQALAALHHLPESQGTCEQAIDLRLEMRNVLIALGDFGRMVELLCEAEVLATALEDQRRLGWVSAYLSPYFSNTGDQDHAIETGQRALAIATASGDFALEMMATFFLGLPYLSLGNYQQEAHYHRRNVEALQDKWRLERFGEPGLPSVFCRAYLDWGLAELGAFVEGWHMEKKPSRSPRRSISPLRSAMRISASVLSTSAKGTSSPPSPCSNRAFASVRPETFRSYSPGLPRPWDMPTRSPGASPKPCRCWSRPWSRTPP